MSSSYNTEQHIKNLIEELQGMIGELEDCLTLIEFANNKEKINEVKKKVNEAKERSTPHSNALFANGMISEKPYGMTTTAKSWI